MKNLRYRFVGILINIRFLFIFVYTFVAQAHCFVCIYVCLRVWVWYYRLCYGLCWQNDNAIVTLLHMKRKHMILLSSMQKVGNRLSTSSIFNGRSIKLFVLLKWPLLWFIYDTWTQTYTYRYTRADTKCAYILWTHIHFFLQPLNKSRAQ